MHDYFSKLYIMLIESEKATGAYEIQLIIIKMLVVAYSVQ